MDLLDEPAEFPSQAPIILDVVSLAELVGYRFPMDWDGEVSIEPPSEIDQRVLTAYLIDRLDQIGDRIRGRAYRALHHYVGGPLNGQRHDFYYQGVWAQDASQRWVETDLPYLVEVHIGLAEWAVYRIEPDGRAFFVGMATSKKKAHEQYFMPLWHKWKESQAARE